MTPEEKLKNDCYELATLRELGNNPQGTRMDVVYKAMDIYADLKVKKAIEEYNNYLSSKK